MKVLTVEPTMVTAASIWHKFAPRTISREHIQVLRPDDMGADAAYTAIVDLMNNVLDARG